MPVDCYSTMGVPISLAKARFVWPWMGAFSVRVLRPQLWPGAPNTVPRLGGRSEVERVLNRVFAIGSPLLALDAVPATLLGDG